MLPDRIVGEQTIEAPQTRSQLDKEFPLRWTSGDTTPDVTNLTRFIANNNGTITQFDNGADGQIIWILGDGLTTVANNANIVRSGDPVLTLDSIYVFVRIEGVWYEINCCGSGPAGPPGMDGADGEDGLPGPPGADGIAGTDGMVPYYIASGETFTVPEFKQATWAVPIIVDGSLVVDGVLVPVD